MKLLDELRAQAKKDFERKWYPGQKLTDVQVLVKYIDALVHDNSKLSSQISDLNWQINPDRMGQ